MATPNQPQPVKGAKSGLKPGDGASPPRNGGDKRPVEEEDIFGGAERTQNEDVKSDETKP